MSVTRNLTAYPFLLRRTAEEKFEAQIECENRVALRPHIQFALVRTCIDMLDARAALFRSGAGKTAVAYKARLAV